MKKHIAFIAFALLISSIGFSQKTNKQLMSLKAEGNDKLKVRMFTDHKSVKAGQEFKIGFFSI